MLCRWANKRASPPVVLLARARSTSGHSVRRQGRPGAAASKSSTAARADSGYGERAPSAAVPVRPCMVRPHVSA